MSIAHVESLRIYNGANVPNNQAAELRAQLAALTTQRNDLLAALEGLVNAPIDDSAELVIAQAAIAAAKGE